MCQTEREGEFKSEVEIFKFHFEIKTDVRLIQKLQRIRDSDEEMQQANEAFFKRFSNLFHECSESVKNHEDEEKEKIAESATAVRADKSIYKEEESQLNATANVPEIENEEKDETASANIDELYTQILFEILHKMGCDVTCELGQTALISYVQDAFKMSSDRHGELLEKAKNMEIPNSLINVEVIEAKDLRSKNSNCLSDPFVTLYLASNTSHRYNTSVKPATLSPVWEEHFALPISENINNDALYVEAWYLNPPESTRKKFSKFFSVKDFKTVGKLIKEIAIATTIGHKHKLIGVAKIAKNTIPASGVTMWYSLDKKDNQRGRIKLRISLTSQKNEDAERNYRYMLEVLLRHELEMSKVAPYWWYERFTAKGEAILTQHVIRSGLNSIEVALCRWCAYASVHQKHPLCLTLFIELLGKLVDPLRNNALRREDVEFFWKAAQKLLPSCFSVIYKIREKDLKDRRTMEQLSEVLNIINMIKSVRLSPNLDIFPLTVYPWLSHSEDSYNHDISSVVHDAVLKGANDWFNYVIANHMEQDVTEAEKLQFVIKAVWLVRSDLNEALQFYDRIFQEKISFQYTKCLYMFYQEKISTLAQPYIRNVCKHLERIDCADLALSETASSKFLADGTILFEAYLALHWFVNFGEGFHHVDSLCIRNFYQWFHDGVAQWLKIAKMKTLQQIETAVELDELVRVTSAAKKSSSAVDTLTIFYQVKAFWQQLNWPDVDSSCSFTAKIVDNICESCVFYAEKMAIRFKGLQDKTDKKKFEVTKELCLAINNIEYVAHSLQPFAEELGVKELMQQLSDLTSVIEADRRRDELNDVIVNTIDTLRNEITSLLEIVVKKMVPTIKQLLIEGAESLSQDNKSIDELMLYTDNNLTTLHDELRTENFDKILEIVWDALGGLFKEIVQSNVNKRRPPSFYATLHKTLHLMLDSFKTSNESSNFEELKTLESTLKINGLETNDLIHLIQLDLYKEFKDLTESQYGKLSVKAKFEDNNLKVEVINARNLMAMDSNGLSDPFVRVHLLPEHRFSEITTPRTHTHYKTLFPLFDETFVIDLPSDYRDTEDGLILFSVKDENLLGYNNRYIGEAFLHFDDVTSEIAFSDLPQRHLPLFRPTESSSEAISVLERRQGDKQAKEFLKKHKQRRAV